MSLEENFSEELMVVSLYIFILKYYKPQHTLNIKGTKEGANLFLFEKDSRHLLNILKSVEIVK